MKIVDYNYEGINDEIVNDDEVKCPAWFAICVSVFLP